MMQFIFQFRPCRVWVILPSILVLLSDAFLTLFYQPQGYWSQSFQLDTESNPVGKFLMRLHPLAFVGGILIYAFVIAVLINRLPSPLEQLVAMAVLLGHTWGTTHWLYNHFSSIYWLRVFAFIAIASITTACWHKANKDAASNALKREANKALSANNC